MVLRKQPPILRVGIVGSGNIAEKYVRDIARREELELVAVTDHQVSRAKQLTDQYGGRAVESLDDVIAEADLVVNLTPAKEHVGITQRCLEARRHVFSEKPLAIHPTDARALVELAEQNAVRLGCAPASLMGEAQQTAWEALRSGRIGTVRAVFAEVSWGWIERWHPKPKPFYDFGPLFDVGVYPLSIVTACLGPARRVQAFGRVLKAARRCVDGTEFNVETPDFLVTVVELEDGAVLRLTASYYVGQQARNQAAVEFHGDEGSVWLGHWFRADAGVEFAERTEHGGDAYSAIPYVRAPDGPTDWSRALVDMAEAIRDGRPHRATGDHAAHVVDIVAAAATSAASDGASIAVTSSFVAPAPMDWARSKHDRAGTA